MVGKICVSITAENGRLMSQKAREALSCGADFVEIRFDSLVPAALEGAVEAVKDLKSKSVFTMRSASQGGNFTGSEPDRIQWIRRIAEQRPMLLDVELETLKNNDDLADFLDRSKTSIIVSWHDFQRTPPTNEIADILAEMRVYSNFVKIVTMAKSTEDSLRLLGMYEYIHDLHPIIFAMGESGVISRVLCTIVGNAPFTYAGLDEAVASGQLNLRQMRKLYDRMADTRA